jgi:hypothetical protein
VVAHAQAAVELYPLHHRRLPYLAHDFAYALVRSRQFTLAWPILESFVRLIPRRHLLPGLATLAWAAAGRGLVHRAEDAERRAIAELAASPLQAAPSLIFLAEAARALGRWTRAERHALEAAAAAQRTNQGRFENDARRLLAEIEQRKPAEGIDAPELVEVYPLVRYFEIRLRRWKPGRDPGEPGAGENRTRRAEA